MTSKSVSTASKSIFKVNEISKEFSSKVVNMSFLCALLVVSIHCEFSKASSGVCWWLEQLFSSGYSRIAVPFFFIVSGYFIAGHFHEHGWWERETTKRVKSLIIPFVSWALLYQIVFLPLSIYADYKARRAFGSSLNCDLFNGHILNVLGLVLDKFPSTVPLWFLRALFLFVLISKGIRKILLSKAALLFLIILFGITVFLPSQPNSDGGVIGFLQCGFRIEGLLYFSLGMFMRIKDIKCDSKKFALIALFIASVILALKIILAYNNVFINFYLMAFAIPLFIYVTWVFMPSRSLPSVFQSTSFPIYLIHTFVLGYWGLFSKQFSWGGGGILSWPVAVAGSIFLAYIMRKYARKVAAYMFGGR